MIKELLGSYNFQEFLSIVKNIIFISKPDQNSDLFDYAKLFLKVESISSFEELLEGHVIKSFEDILAQVC